ncbi:MAG: desulfoferrodoxin family protein [Sphaerochaetaceae bacterium]|jgi:superoxide reductase
MEFYVCKICGNIIAYVNNTGIEVECCGQPMELIVPGSTDGAKEKHVPVIKREGNLVTVTVGSVEHPMTEAHYIQWIALETKAGNQRVELKPGQKPVATFAVKEGDTVISAYEYCNLHGLFKA